MSITIRPGSGWAAAAIGVTAGFIAISVWWLGQDRGVPVGDAASYLLTIVANHHRITDGDVVRVFSSVGRYPPMAILVGTAATFVGGIDTASPVVGENLVYIPLLALACYQLGRLVAGPQAGFLAVAFALGSPLLIEQFHVLMLDAPMAVMVALAVWLILASERFCRIGISALAGAAVGLGFETKEQFPLFIAGLLAVVLLRQRGWRNWRGILTFATAAVIVGAPWYIAHLGELGTFASSGLLPADLPARAHPPVVSLANLGWYFWALLNAVLFTPLFTFAAIGTGVAIVGLMRARRPRAASASSPIGGLAPELLGGLLVAWLALSLQPHHDTRYAQSLIVYVAVIGTSWIAHLNHRARSVVSVSLVAATVATTLGTSFGVGHPVRVTIARDPYVADTIYGVPPLDQVTIYANEAFNLSSPRTDDDVLALFQTLRRNDITGVIWRERDFETQGLLLFAYLAGLDAPTPGATNYSTHGRSGPLPAAPHAFPWARRWRWNVADAHHVMLVLADPSHPGPPCPALRGQHGLGLLIGNPADARAYCPRERT